VCGIVKQTELHNKIEICKLEGISGEKNIKIYKRGFLKYKYFF